MNKAYLKEKVYSFNWAKDSSRNAAIVFIFDGLKWKFSKCTYNTLNKIYEIDDWEFLRCLADEIIRLDKEEHTDV